MEVESSLEERLRNHAKAFDGLLSLIPSKLYYGEDTSDQWHKKKQTKEQAAAARRAKLDPDSALNRNAKAVMDERARNKRKIQETEQTDEDEDDDEGKNVDQESPAEGITQEKPGEGLKKKPEADAAKPNKRQKVAEDNDVDMDEKKKAKLEKKAEKAALKKEKQNAKAERRRAKEERRAAKAADNGAPKEPEPNAAHDGEASSHNEELEQQTEKGHGDAASADQPVNLPNLEHRAAEASSQESAPQSPTFDSLDSLDSHSTPAADGTASTTTSISSTVAPSEKPKQIKVPADTTALRARLAARIAELRAARKADGPDGKPIRTRAELIEQRRAKEAARKAHKKELRREAKLEEERKREEALSINSPMSPVLDLDEAAAELSFGRVAFADGARLSRDLGHVLKNGKTKGPSDPKTALLKLQNEKQRVAGLDKEKREDVEEKETWLKARQRAEGEKVHDSEALLKKAVKRKENKKKRSEREWKERAIGVEKAQKDRQKKREVNLRKRKEEKILRKIGKKNKKTKARPGFEGSLGLGRRKQK